MFVKWVGRCGRLIPQWSQDCLEACCVWSLSGHFNISPGPRIGPHVAPAITGGSPLVLPPPSAALPRPVAAVCHFCCVYQTAASHIPPLSLCFLFLRHVLFKHQTRPMPNAERDIFRPQILFTVPPNIASSQFQRRFARGPLTPSPSSTFSTISPLTQCLLYH